MQLENVSEEMIEDRIENELCVLVGDNNCGYFWFPQTNAESLETWWTTLEDARPFWVDATALHGDVYQIEHLSRLHDRFLAMDKAGRHYNLHVDKKDSLLITPDQRRLYPINSPYLDAPKISMEDICPTFNGHVASALLAKILHYEFNNEPSISDFAQFKQAVENEVLSTFADEFEEIIWKAMMKVVGTAND